MRLIVMSFAETFRPNLRKILLAIALAHVLGYFVGGIAYLMSNCLGNGPGCAAYSPVGVFVGYVLLWPALLGPQGNVLLNIATYPVVWLYYYVLVCVVWSFINPRLHPKLGGRSSRFSQLFRRDWDRVLLAAVLALILGYVLGTITQGLSNCRGNGPGCAALSFICVLVEYILNWPALLANLLFPPLFFVAFPAVCLYYYFLIGVVARFIESRKTEIIQTKNL